MFRDGENVSLFISLISRPIKSSLERLGTRELLFPLDLTLSLVYYIGGGDVLAPLDPP